MQIFKDPLRSLKDFHQGLLSVNLNQTATFYCSVAGNPKPSVSWSKINGTRLIKTDYPSNTLEIKNVGFAESYVCTATSILGQAEEVVKLYVEGNIHYMYVTHFKDIVVKWSNFVIQKKKMEFKHGDLWP